MPAGLLYGGIDPSGSPARPSGVAVLAESLQVLEARLCRCDDEIVAFFAPHRSTLFALGLDGPCALPQGLGECCFRTPEAECLHEQPHGRKGRVCERELARRGIGCFFTVKKSFAKEWVLRSLRLYRLLRAAGLEVVEVYPYASKRLLFGPGPSKGTERGRLVLTERLCQLGIRMPEGLCHHQLDAVVAAYTVYLLAHDEAEMVGDEAEGYVVIPKVES